MVKFVRRMPMPLKSVASTSPTDIFRPSACSAWPIRKSRLRAIKELRLSSAAAAAPAKATTMTPAMIHLRMLGLLTTKPHALFGHRGVVQTPMVNDGIEETVETESEQYIFLSERLTRSTRRFNPGRDLSIPRGNAALNGGAF